MLKISPLDYKYCPFCKGNLLVKLDDGYLRKHCSSCGWTYYPQVFDSVAAVISKNKKILLVKRGREPYKDTWMFPGGFVEYGEHPEETLKREVIEETGLKVKKASLLEIVQSVDDPRAPGNLIFFYKVKPYSGSLETDKNENVDIGWFSKSDLPKIGWKSHKYIIKLISKEK